MQANLRWTGEKNWLVSDGRKGIEHEFWSTPSRSANSVPLIASVLRWRQSHLQYCIIVAFDVGKNMFVKDNKYNTCAFAQVKRISVIESHLWEPSLMVQTVWYGFEKMVSKNQTKPNS